MEGVSDNLGQLGKDVDMLEGSLRGEIRAKLGQVRQTLMEALDRVGESIRQIKQDVQRGAL